MREIVVVRLDLGELVVLGLEFHLVAIVALG